ncbi:hypothetical protein BDP81DRAFT_207897 [Colletotrichum phormii]|uniref:Uncharacterized protein n=1 Tax=Colletotrichum phormii TaxID=359342 RepID=A0AAI9ZWV2_9PEZI|nr:uncharacterized protein BDP81DRAFT_207897 [Colletotrichum phormii]KAK1638433.1 hypothetical protein BDP81DRAFT_207897 [Colletotrichum phormii]
MNRRMSCSCSSQDLFGLVLLPRNASLQISFATIIARHPVYLSRSCPFKRQTYSVHRISPITHFGRLLPYGLATLHYTLDQLPLLCTSYAYLAGLFIQSSYSVSRRQCSLMFPRAFDGKTYEESSSALLMQVLTTWTSTPPAPARPHSSVDPSRGFLMHAEGSIHAHGAIPSSRGMLWLVGGRVNMY